MLVDCTKKACYLLQNLSLNDERFQSRVADNLAINEITLLSQQTSNINSTIQVKYFIIYFLMSSNQIKSLGLKKNFSNRQCTFIWIWGLYLEFFERKKLYTVSMLYCFSLCLHKCFWNFHIPTSALGGSRYGNEGYRGLMSEYKVNIWVHLIWLGPSCSFMLNYCCCHFSLFLCDIIQASPCLLS